jgi:hypothetical protein
MFSGKNTIIQQDDPADQVAILITGKDDTTEPFLYRGQAKAAPLSLHNTPLESPSSL